ncbi:hypothetical protein PMAYCL1PPCAC_15462, partial [Pristionchus mayeri]
LNLDLLFEPFPLFPACAGYCIGILCRIGVPMHFCLGIATLVLVNTGSSIIGCFVHRHQAIVGVESRLKFNQKIASIIRYIFLIVTSISVFAWVFLNPHDKEKVDRALEKSSVNLTWIKDRGSYIYIERTAEIYLI